MDFTLDDEQQAIHDITKQVLGDLSTHSRLKDLAVADDHVDCDAWAALAEAGVVGASIPEGHGGAGLGFLATAMAMEVEGSVEASSGSLFTLVKKWLLTERAAKRASPEVLVARLEGDVVASDGRYNLRGPRVFYDVRNDRALILDAVFSTFDTRVGFPLYVRARSVRQLSEDEFVADRASVSNTAFARPNLTIGARNVTIRQENRTLADGSDDPYLVADAKNITLNGLGVPIGWLPAYEGNPEEIPLRDVRFVTSSRSGEEIRTRWDLFPLLGIDEPEQLSANLLLDALFDNLFGHVLRNLLDASFEGRGELADPEPVDAVAALTFVPKAQISARTKSSSGDVGSRR